MRLLVQPLSENAWAYITLSRAADKVPAEGKNGRLCALDRPGDDGDDGPRLRPRLPRARPRLLGVYAALPAPRLGRARRGGDLAREPGRRRGRAEGGGRRGAELARRRHHEPARDGG